MRTRALAGLLIAAGISTAALALTGCSGGSSSTTSTTTPTVTVKKPPAAKSTLWLCFPGRAGDPCTGSLATTVIRADGKKTVVTPRAAANPPIDCFYVYPTVSNENTGNASLQIGLPCSSSRRRRPSASRRSARCTPRCTGRSRTRA